jgi:Pectate lyase superfamily protein
MTKQGGIGATITQTSGIAVSLIPATDGQAAVMVNGTPTAVGVRPLFNVRSFGAVGDGTTDDTAAIQAAEHARATFTVGGQTGGVVYFPTGTYAITAELRTEGPGAIWEGDGNNQATSLKATAPIRAVLSVRHAQCAFRDFFINGNFLSHYCVLRAGDTGSHYHRIGVYAALFDGFSSIGQPLPGRTITSITQSGPGPSISATVSAVSGTSLGQPSMVIEIVASGPADGMAQYRFSEDGGLNYGPPQGCYPISFPAYNRGTLEFANSTGIKVAFSGSYVLGTTYTIALDYGGSGGSLALNDASVFDNCSASFCGRWIRTAGSFDPAGFLSSTTVTASITTASREPVVTITGFDLTTANIREGDFLFVVGLDKWLQIVAVLDATHMAVGFESAMLLDNRTNADFILSIGAGFYDCFQFDAGLETLIGGNYGSSCAQGVVWMGAAAGNTCVSTSCAGQGGVGWTVGCDVQSSPPGTSLIRPYFEEGLSIGIPFMSFTGDTHIQSPTNLRYQGKPLGSLIRSGLYYGHTRTVSEAEFWVPNGIAITSDNQPLTAPNFSDDVFEPTNFFDLIPNAPYILGPLSAPNINGCVVRLHNNSSYPLEIRDFSFGVTSYITQSPQTTLTPSGYIDFYWNGNNWVQLNALRESAVNVRGTSQGDATRYLTTTDATPTTAIFLNRFADPTWSGFSADVTAHTPDGSQLIIWEDVRARFANNVQLGATTIGHVTGTGPGVATWGGPSITVATNDIRLVVTGAVSTTIQWRIKVRYF